MRNRRDNSKFKIKEMPAERDAWLLSYADIITMLLCFFVLFFSFEKEKTSGEFQDVMSFIREELGLKNMPVSSMKNVKELIKARFGDEKLVTGLEKLNVTNNVKILNYANYVAIEFPQGNMFESGSEFLNSDGKSQIMPVISSLKNYQNKLNINIVAYTDPSPVNTNIRTPRWWKNNRELSVQRALNVQQLFLKNGFDENSVFISGKGIKNAKDTVQVKPYALNGQLIDTSTFNQSRTISIRLESKDIP